jgi:hypothetical protein
LLLPHSATRTSSHPADDHALELSQERNIGVRRDHCTGDVLDDLLQGFSHGGGGGTGHLGVVL